MERIPRVRVFRSFKVASHSSSQHSSLHGLNPGSASLGWTPRVSRIYYRNPWRCRGSLFTLTGHAGRIRGPGGWAAVLIYQGRQRCSRSRAPNTTNNRMELIAAIEALNALKRPCAVELFTDSQYLRQGIQSWLPHWKTRGFVTMDGQPVKNQDLWQKLEHTAGRHKVEWKWVRGHARDPMNELCDRSRQRSA